MGDESFTFIGAGIYPAPKYGFFNEPFRYTLEPADSKIRPYIKS